MFDFFYSLLGKVISFFNGITGNYLVAVILFALLFKIILFPFSIKQQKNSIKQAKLRPKEMAIKKKYKGRDDQDSKMKMQQEIQEMYQKEGYNAFSGCLPLLLQLPIILALYEVIRSPLTYICGLKNVIKGSKEVASIAEQLKNLTGGKALTQELSLVNWLREGDNLEKAREIVTELPKTVEELPDFTVFGINLGVVPMEGWSSNGAMGLLWFLIPLLTFAFAYGSMKLTRKMSYQPEQSADMGCSMKVMDFSMPLMSAAFAASWPSIMGVYWMLSNILSVVQQFILKLMYPLPVLTEEDYKEAERQYRGKAPKNGPVKDPRVIEGKQYRSLHHIDDEDEDETPTLPPMQIDEDEDEPAPERPADAPRLKEDDRDYRKKKRN
jgi:YidC/Oxa1 family membrane protein insertase